MQKKLTITVDSKVYEGLHSVIGRGNISQFLERLARPYVLNKDLATSYREMANDSKREAEANEWVENLAQDIDETR
jgi:predicted CopG family antitoxin